MNSEKIQNHIVNWLTDYIQQSKTKGFVIGVSGGIDSAVTSTLAAKTGLPLLCVEMPIHQDKNQVTRAKNHINWLKHEYNNVLNIETDLTVVFDTFSNSISHSENKELDFLSLANARARLRMTTLYYYAQINNYLVLGTGNKVEDFGVGFYTKYGDGGVDLSPIADLVKTEVFALGKQLKVIEEILNAAPTDGLWGDERTDEDQLGASYPELEWAMEISEKANIDFTSFTIRQQQVFEIYTRLNTVNQHKMRRIPVCEISAVIKG
ncbi:MAG: NAD(+) synthase [Flavobacteriales bacterium]|nr:NAD(+) synthase [Flavobacteriales bacterium]